MFLLLLVWSGPLHKEQSLLNKSVILWTPPSLWCYSNSLCRAASASAETFKGNVDCFWSLKQKLSLTCENQMISPQKWKPFFYCWSSCLYSVTPTLWSATSSGQSGLSGHVCCSDVTFILAKPHKETQNTNSHKSTTHHQAKVFWLEMCPLHQIKKNIVTYIKCRTYRIICRIRGLWEDGK